MQSNRISGQIFSNTITDSDLTVTNENPTITNRNEFRNSRVLIIGLGQLGLPVAKYVKEKGFDTYGYDIEQKAMERAEKVASIKKADNLVSLMYTLFVFLHTSLRTCLHLR